MTGLNSTPPPPKPSRIIRRQQEAILPGCSALFEAGADREVEGQSPHPPGHLLHELTAIQSSKPPCSTDVSAVGRESFGEAAQAGRNPEPQNWAG